MELTEAKRYIAEQWNHWSVSYDEQYAHGVKSHAEVEAWKKVLATAIGTTPCRILDVGTGTGFLALLLAEMGHNCTGLDISDKMLEQAKKKGTNLKNRPVFDFGDAEALPLPDNCMDVVANRHLLWTLPDPQKALTEWLRVLKPGGKLVVINGVWGSIGLPAKARRLIGNIMIMLAEHRNPWKDGYSNEVKEQLPLYGDVPPEEIIRLMREAGVEDVQMVDMSNVERAENAAMPLRYRIAYSHKRYLIVGKKK
ncbi:methyltransferase domain-containing protein [Thermincola potens]|uniref:Methyltransferase type 11 n=1 Tax=Thermincola potens (strain JR) TaxID=635013 RepID=D5XEM8_THEPJ|nr:methyltransferase domain-containing protein [Thermincola potens]ADG82099.1 Methyltransferase type 11 [Thermincola potens JR]